MGPFYKAESGVLLRQWAWCVSLHVVIMSET